MLKFEKDNSTKYQRYTVEKETEEHLFTVGIVEWTGRGDLKLGFYPNRELSPQFFLTPQEMIEIANFIFLNQKTK